MLVNCFTCGAKTEDTEEWERTGLCQKCREGKTVGILEAILESINTLICIGLDIKAELEKKGEK